MEKVKRLDHCRCQHIDRLVSLRLIDRLTINLAISGWSFVWSFPAQVHFFISARISWHDYFVVMFFLLRLVLWQCSPSSHSGGVWGVTFQKVIVSFTVSRWHSGEGPSYNQPCNLPCFSVSRKTQNPSQLQKYMGMALCQTLHFDLWPPCGEGQEQISQGRILKKKKKAEREEVTFKSGSEHCSCFPSHLNQVKLKFSLKHFLRARVKWAFWSRTLHASHCQYIIICTVALLLCVMPK